MKRKFYSKTFYVNRYWMGMVVYQDRLDIIFFHIDRLLLKY